MTYRVRTYGTKKKTQTRAKCDTTYQSARAHDMSPLPYERAVWQPRRQARAGNKPRVCTACDRMLLAKQSMYHRYLVQVPV